MSRKIEFYVVDIFIASEKIQRYSAPFTSAEDFLHSELEWDAVIRELEIIGEATNKLLQNQVLDTQYRMIVDFRNQIIHGYFGIDENIVWEVITVLLDEFIESLYTLIKTDKLSLAEAITCAKEDHHYNNKTLTYLSTLSTQSIL
jgi:uncharacterized protein with HEPN domain